MHMGGKGGTYQLLRTESGQTMRVAFGPAAAGGEEAGVCSAAISAALSALAFSAFVMALLLAASRLWLCTRRAASSWLPPAGSASAAAPCREPAAAGARQASGDYG